jgi:ornithine carbamoyltransferase
VSTADGSNGVVRHFISLRDWGGEELAEIIAHAIRLKAGHSREPRPLAGKTLAMVFRKSSTRTRVSFQAAMLGDGGHAIVVDAQGSHVGRGEGPADTARVLSRYVDGIMIRTYEHAEVEDFARHATVPVINGLTDLLHPCQLLADVMTMKESFGTDLHGVPVAWVGDGNNVAHSWIHAAGRFGFPLRIACPEGYDPDPVIVEWGRANADITLMRDPNEAVAGARVVTTDTWASMGQEDEKEERAAAFAGFCVDDAMMERAAGDAIFLHCLPAYRGSEVTASVIDGPRSRVFDEAENRMHAQKALLIALLGS